MFLAKNIIYLYSVSFFNRIGDLDWKYIPIFVMLLISNTDTLRHIDTVYWRTSFLIYYSRNSWKHVRVYGS